MPLLSAIYRQEKSVGVWKEDTYLRKHPQGPCGNVESIILRFPKTEPLEGSVDEHESDDQPVFSLLPEARPLIFSLMSEVAGERLGRCIINKLKSGGIVYKHCDSESHARYYDRFHIVLQSSGGCVFRCEDEQVSMQVGEVWWFNNALEHEVINNSSDDRIHLIIDIRTKK